MNIAGKVRGHQNEFENVVVDNVVNLPSNPVEGQIAWFSPGKKLYIYDGTEWKEIATHEPGAMPITLVNLHLTGWLDVDGLTQLNDLEVQGNSFLAKDVRTEDNIITLNYGETALGVAQWGPYAGIEVDRGLYPMVSIVYDETIDRWTLTHNGTDFATITTNADDDTFLRLDNGSHPFVDISWNNRKITMLHDPSDPQDAVNLRTLDAKLDDLRTDIDDEIDDIVSNLNFIKQDGTNSPTADIDWASNKITNLADPTLPNDAATKEYVDKSKMFFGTFDISFSSSGSPTTYYFDFTQWYNDYCDQYGYIDPDEFIVFPIVNYSSFKVANPNPQYESGTPSMGDYYWVYYVASEPTYYASNGYQFSMAIGARGASSSGATHSYSTKGTVSFHILFLGGPKEIILHYYGAITSSYYHT